MNSSLANIRKKSLLKQDGMALVITLAILVIVTVLAIGLTVTMRLERASSHSHLERVRAGDFAQIGVECAVGQLKAATANADINWVSSPGGLLMSDVGSTRLANPVKILHSGTVSGTLTGVFRPANLNARMLRDYSTPTFLITDQKANAAEPAGTVAELPVRWIYVRENGTWDEAEIPSLSNTSNPIVGRFGYWTDDESCRINLNIAWKRGDTSFPNGHPSNVSLTGLDGMTEEYADILHNTITEDNYLTVNRFFNSPQDAWGLNENIYEVLNSSKFELTHYNHEPNTTYFNQPRIVLTTQKSKADGYPFIDVGGIDKVDATKVNSTIKTIVDYLKRTDWPVVIGNSSFQSKYYDGSIGNLAHLAVNIIDYVRSKESAEALVVPIRTSYSGVSVMGITRTPMINEVGVWINPERSRIRFKVELYLPEGYGVNSSDNKVNIGGDGSLFISYRKEDGTVASSEAKIIAANCSSGSTQLRAGEYVTVTKEMNITSTPFVTRPTLLPVRVAFSRVTNDERLDIAPLSTLNSATPSDQVLYVPIDPPNVAENDIRSMEVNDPRINDYAGDWKECSGGGPNTFGRVNSNYRGGQYADAITPQQDTDENGRISTASLFMPFPHGDAKNLSGLVTSVGELGYIHTGADSKKSGIPWRTVRLQPNNYPDTSIVPDWALLDLFSAPIDTPEAANGIFKPGRTSVGGKININSKMEPYGNAPFLDHSIERTKPLSAILDGVQKNSSGMLVSSVEAVSAATNIYRHNTADGGDLGKKYGNASYYDLIGEIVEIKGVADTGEESEEVMRGIASLITTRSNVFTIYSIGQSLKQTPSGHLVINGEQRLQSMIERYQDLNSSEARFRTVYFRNLTP